MTRTKTTMVLNRASRQIGLECMAVLLLAGFCFSQTVSVSVKNGPPTSKTLVSGSGFAANTAIDIYFDTTDEALASTNSSGAFSKIAIQVPASALPGQHWVTAVQRSGETSAQTPFNVNTNWAEFGFTANGDWFNPYENVLSPSTVGGIDLLWTYTTGAVVVSSPAVANGTVYIGSMDNNVYAINATTGAKLWSYTTGGSVESSPAVANGVVYVGSDDGYLYALSAKTGAVQWSLNTLFGPVSSSPVVVNGVVYIGYGLGIFAANASTGATLWVYPAGPVYLAPTVSNGVVYFASGSNDNNFYALNATTGAQLWNFYDPTGNPTSAAVANGLVYVGDDGGNVWALISEGGGPLWSFADPTGKSFTSPAVANGVVYIGSFDDNVYALNATTGTQLWSYASPLPVGPSPAVANGVVYVGSSTRGLGYVYALDAAYGSLLWSYTTGDIVSSLAVANGVVYTGSYDNNVYAFGQTNAPAAGQLSKPPSLKTLHPNYNLKPSQPATNLPSGDNN